MSIPAGWYPDPQQQDQLRYWDGSVWTEHQTPAQAADPAPQGQTDGYGAASAPQGQTDGYGAASAPQGQTDGYGASAPQDTSAPRTGASAGYGAAPAPGTADQTSPYGNFSGSESATQSFAAPGHDPSQQGGFGPASSSPAYGANPGQGGGYGPPGPMPPAGKPNRTPLIIGGIVGLVVVVGLVLLGVNLMSGGEDPPPTSDPTPTATDDPTSADPTDDPTDQQSGGTADAGVLAVGASVHVDIPEDGTGTATLTVDQTQVVRVYTSSNGNTDPVMKVLDADGNVLAEDDDTEYESPNSYDASVQVTLAQGEYAIELAEWSGSPSQVTVAAEAVGETTQIELGESQIQVAEDGAFVGLVSVQPGTYTVNIVSDEDPTLQVVTPGGEMAENDDRESDAPDQDNIFDPYLEVTVSEAGDLALLVEEYSGDAFNGTITIEQQ
ncbi:DUF2510 domain-containing protein [Ruania zhangjianzhongii]|uniref:DUF2510 domain-containing protein n=1 Tax=Ruania zhangjianzhongii TaxID=2603206 RepID=UPI0011C9FF15|nr:DUF2510 domain-containing protein [Ruania zhangjianzhongii]